MTDFTMPSLGADMERGTVLEWLVAPGDEVHRGDPMAVVDTSKAAVEVESFADGTVTELVVPVGSDVPVGTVLAHLTAPGGAQPHPERPTVHSPLVRKRAHDLGVDLDALVGTGTGGEITRDDVDRAVHGVAPAPDQAEHDTAAPGHAASEGAEPTGPRPPAAAQARTRRRCTPYARRLARELGLDVDAVPPADGETVRAADVRSAADAGRSADADRSPAAAPSPIETPPAGAAASPPADPAARSRAMRETIARLMARSKREIPHYYLTATVDLSTALAWMREQNAGLPISERLVPAALLLRATAVATARHPALNGFWVDDAFEPGPGVHLGVAISLRGGGLVAPAIHDADRLSVAETMSAMRDLVSRARAGRLRGSEMTDPTLTVTNLGEQGVESVLGVIYPPQVALVGFGRVVERPWAVDGMLGIRAQTTATLAADHRATDGFTGGRFLAAVDDLLQHPEEL